MVTIHLRNGVVDRIHELNMFAVLDKVRDKDDWRKQIERMKRGRHHLTMAYREGGFGVFKPPLEIPKISVESSIA